MSPELWWSWGGWLAAWLLTYAVHSTLTLGAVWLIVHRWGDQRLYVQDLLWRAALIAGFFTATCQSLVKIDPLFGHWPLFGTEVAAAPAATEGPQASPSSVDTSVDTLVDTSVNKGAVVATKGPVGATNAETEPVTQSATEPEAPKISVFSSEISPSHGTTPQTPVMNSGKEKTSPKYWITGSTNENPRAIQTATSAETVPASPTAVARSVPATAAAASATTKDARSATSHWWGWLLAGWVLGASALGGLLVLAWQQLYRRLGGPRQEVTSGPARQLLDRLTVQAGLKRIRLISVPRLRGPLAWGVFQPTICLPAWATTELSPAQLESLLAHEVAHLVRKDPAWLLAFRVLECVFFFQPLLRVARRHWQETAEYLCDSWAVEQTGQGVVLARCLTEVAGWVLVNEAAPVWGLAQKSSPLKRRIERLLSPAAPSGGGQPALVGPLLGLGIIAIAITAPKISFSDSPQISPRVEPDAVVTAPETVAPAPQKPPAEKVALPGFGGASNATDLANLPTALPQSGGPSRGSLTDRNVPLAGWQEDLRQFDSELDALRLELQALREILPIMPEGAGLLPAIDRIEASLGRIVQRRVEAEQMLRDSEQTTEFGPAGPPPGSGPQMFPEPMRPELPRP